MEALCPTPEGFYDKKAAALKRITARNSNWKKKGKGMSKRLTK